MARRFTKVSEEEIEEAFFYPSDLVNTKTTIPLRVGEERWIYTSTLRVSVYIHHYSPPLRGIVVYYLVIFHVKTVTRMARTLARMNRMARTLARMTRMVCAVTRMARWLAH